MSTRSMSSQLRISASDGSRHLQDAIEREARLGRASRLRRGLDPFDVLLEQEQDAGADHESKRDRHDDGAAPVEDSNMSLEFQQGAAT